MLFVKYLSSIQAKSRTLGKKLRLKRRYSSINQRTTRVAKRRPILSFVVVLLVLLVLIALGSFIRKPKMDEIAQKAEVKSVQMYSIGKSPTATFQAKVEKTGIVEIKSLMGGIVQSINVTEGQEVGRGTTLVSLSSNYQGGNTATVQRQMAATQYNNVVSTLPAQKDVIYKQREIAQKTSESSEEMRKISESVIGGIESSINLNNTMIQNLNTTLTQLQNANGDPQQILQTQQALSQLNGANVGLQTQLRTTRYQTNTENAPVEIANLSRDMTLKQLEIQEKALDLQLETSRLQLQMAQIAEAAMYPAAPFAGTIERVHVTPGQMTTPGQPLITLHGDQTMKAVVTVPASIAQNVSRVEVSTLTLPNGRKIESVPLYVSSEATYGQLYSIVYEIPSEYQDQVSNNSYISVSVPSGNQSTTASIPVVPLDAVYQTQNSAYIFVNVNGTAKSRNVTLGQVVGEFVEIENGLSRGDEVIVSRSIINGDRVKGN